MLPEKNRDLPCIEVEVEVEVEVEARAPRYHAGQEYLGEGLFPGSVVGERESLDRANAILENVSKYEASLTVSLRSRLVSQMKSVCHTYWHEEAFFSRAPFGKKELLAFRRFKAAAASVVDVLKESNLIRPRSPRQKFVCKVIRDGLNTHRLDFEQALPIILEHLGRIAAVSAPKGTKGRHDQVHINHAVAKVREMWTMIGGKAIERNPQVSRKNGGFEFVQFGPRFVFDVMKAIDCRVELAQVKTALRQPVKAKSRPKNS